MKKASLIAVAATVVLGGCASAKMDYNPGVASEIKSQLDVNEPFDIVWNRLVKSLSSDFFVINNIEKESRIINVSFSSDSPEKYVDCGTTSREFVNARGKQVYTYKTAGSARFTTIVPANGLAINVNRTTKLEGRANIYVASSGKNSTTVSVNVKYVIPVSLDYIDLTGRPAGHQSVNFDLSTKQPYRENSSDSDKVFCASNGVLEGKILEYAK